MGTGGRASRARFLLTSRWQRPTWRPGRRRGIVPDHRMVERDGVSGSKANAEYFQVPRFTTTCQVLPREPALRWLRPWVISSLPGRQAADAWEDFAAFLLKTYDPHDVTDHFSAGEKEYQWRLENVLQEKRTAAQLWDYGLEQTTLYENQDLRGRPGGGQGGGLSLPFGTDAEKRDGIRAAMESPVQRTHRVTTTSCSSGTSTPASEP